jgi:hypothetical protein
MAEQITIEEEPERRSFNPAMTRLRSSNHHIRELLIHTAAFFLAAAAGAVILGHYYWFFEWNTDDASGARDAFLASVVVVGGFGPAITMLFLWVSRMMRRGKVSNRHV